MSTWIDHPLHCDCIECVAHDPQYAGKRGTARALIERLAYRGVSFRLTEDGKVRLTAFVITIEPACGACAARRDRWHPNL